MRDPEHVEEFEALAREVESFKEELELPGDGVDGVDGGGILDQHGRGGLWINNLNNLPIRHGLESLFRGIDAFMN